MGRGKSELGGADKCYAATEALRARPRPSRRDAAAGGARLCTPSVCNPMGVRLTKIHGDELGATDDLRTATFLQRLTDSLVVA